MNIIDVVPKELTARYEFHNYCHALEILVNAFPDEWNEILDCLRTVFLTEEDIKTAGGNESPIPKKFDDMLYPCGWREIRISGDLVVKKFPRQTVQRRGRFSDQPFETEVIEGYIDGHNIDFLKNKVAFDLEWNSKDQTFDRDLLAMRTYYDCGLVDVGVIVTRSEELNELFRIITDDKGVPLLKKYGASTTWMGKLTTRLDSRRHGGCPILAIGIKKGNVKDYERLIKYYTEFQKLY